MRYKALARIVDLAPYRWVTCWRLFVVALVVVELERSMESPANMVLLLIRVSRCPDFFVLMSRQAWLQEFCVCRSCDVQNNTCLEDRIGCPEVVEVEIIAQVAESDLFLPLDYPSGGWFSLLL
jgi:hypothetical protein